jgi:hypothetical protein
MVWAQPTSGASILPPFLDPPQSGTTYDDLITNLLFTFNCPPLMEQHHSGGVVQYVQRRVDELFTSINVFPAHHAWVICPKKEALAHHPPQQCVVKPQKATKVKSDPGRDIHICLFVNLRSSTCPLENTRRRNHRTIPQLHVSVGVWILALVQLPGGILGSLDLPSTTSLHNPEKTNLAPRSLNLTIPIRLATWKFIPVPFRPT